jgi:hypothetical protein
MLEPNTGDRNSHGSRVEEFRTRKIAARFPGRRRNFFNVRGTSKSLRLATVSKVQAHLRDAARFRARSTSHAVAAHCSCIKIPLSAGRAQEDENHSRKRHSGHDFLRFVYLDPPGLIRS